MSTQQPRPARTSRRAQRAAAADAAAAQAASIASSSAAAASHYDGPARPGRPGTAASAASGSTASTMQAPLPLPPTMSQLGVTRRAPNAGRTAAPSADTDPFLDASDPQARNMLSYEDSESPSDEAEQARARAHAHASNDHDDDLVFYTVQPAGGAPFAASLLSSPTRRGPARPPAPGSKGTFINIVPQLTSASTHDGGRRRRRRKGRRWNGDEHEKRANVDGASEDSHDHEADEYGDEDNDDDEYDEDDDEDDEDAGEGEGDDGGTGEAEDAEQRAREARAVDRRLTAAAMDYWARGGGVGTSNGDGRLPAAAEALQREADEKVAAEMMARLREVVAEKLEGERWRYEGGGGDGLEAPLV